MICVEFLAQPDGRVMGFRVEGHSGYAEEGADIVCAAVSSAAYLIVNSVTEVRGVSPLCLRAVSYTHLDVYKRQEPERMPLALPEQLELIPYGCTSLRMTELPVLFV